jgi:hypothetical protein
MRMMLWITSKRQDLASFRNPGHYPGGDFVGIRTQMEGLRLSAVHHIVEANLGNVPKAVGLRLSA